MFNRCFALKFRFWSTLALNTFKFFVYCICFWILSCKQAPCAWLWPSRGHAHETYALFDVWVNVVGGCESRTKTSPTEVTLINFKPKKMSYNVVKLKHSGGGRCLIPLSSDWEPGTCSSFCGYTKRCLWWYRLKSFRQTTGGANIVCGTEVEQGLHFLLSGHWGIVLACLHVWQRKSAIG